MSKRVKKILFFVALIMCILSIFITHKELVKKELYNKYVDNVGSLQSGDIVQFEFKCQVEKLSGISVLAATYENVVSSGEIKFELIKSKDNTVAVEKVIPASEIKDNRYFTIYFDEIEASKDVEYVCHFEIYDTDVPITLWKDNEEDKNINRNNQEIPGNLILNIYESKTTRPYVWDSILIFVVLCSIISLCSDKIQEKKDVSNKDEEFIKKTVKDQSN